MAVGKVTPQFTRSSVINVIQKQLDRINEAIYNRFVFIGETFVGDARNNGNYTDQTGNLRSSIGYVILKDGIQLTESFEGEQEEGKAKAREVIEKVTSSNARGYVLIVVAGMDYAAAVESNGYDVLTSSGIKAETSLKKAIASLGGKI